MELRHTGNLKIFSENASTNESSAFGTTTNTDDINTLLNTNFQVGWENGIDEDGFPLRKWFNGKDKAITKLIAYLFQQGTPKYDATQKYYVDSVCVYSGKVYISLVGTGATPNVGNTPSSSIGTSWNILNMNHLTGAISNILTSNLTANRALISDSSGKITVSSITSTILGYLANVSSDIQTQLNGKTPLNGSGANGTWGINITGVADNLTTPSGTYKHVGAWGIDGIGVAGAILVNSAYRAENLTTPSSGYKHVGVWGIDDIRAAGAILVNSAYRAERCQDLSNHQWAGYGTTGYERRSTGIIEQWGNVYHDFTEGESIDVYFATTFPSSCYNVVLCSMGGTSISNDNGSLELVAMYTNRFTVRSNSQSHIQGILYTAKGA